MMEMADARAALADLKVRLKARAVALVGRDGQVVAADLASGSYAETFSIMCATAFGASVAANAELGLAPPQRLVLESEETRSVIVPAGPHGLLVAVVPTDQDLSRLLREMGKFAGPLGGPAA